jgi:hypothetical protein
MARPPRNPLSEKKSTMRFNTNDPGQIIKLATIIESKIEKTCEIDALPEIFSDFLDYCATFDAKLDEKKRYENLPKHHKAMFEGLKKNLEKIKASIISIKKLTTNQTDFPVGRLENELDEITRIAGTELVNIEKKLTAISDAKKNAADQKSGPTPNQSSP